MTQQYGRDFKGVWIPRVVWLDERLNMLEKGILAEIDSLDMSDSGCFASNKYIADFCQCSERTVTSAISKMVELGYLESKLSNGGQRILRSRLAKFARQGRKNCEAGSQNLRHSNTSNKTNNNTESKKKESKKAGYETLLSEIKDESLKQAFCEYIKMRTLIKAPMTDRALQMLITKVQTLEPDSVARQKELLETAILNNWKSVYPLRDEPKKVQNPRNPKAKKSDGVMDELQEMYNSLIDTESDTP